MRTGLCILMFASLVFAAGVASSSLVITEVMQNPSAVTDANGEWFEVYNEGMDDIDMEGYTLLDADTDIHVITASVVVASGAYVVLGINADMLTNGGAPVAYQYATFFLANGADEIIILDADAVEVTRIEWDGGPVWPDPTGASMNYNGTGPDENDGTRWFEEDVFTFGMGDFGTPGEPREGVVADEASTWGSVKTLYSR